jgi:hypothetical protein
MQILGNEPRARIAQKKAPSRLACKINRNAHD